MKNVEPSLIFEMLLAYLKEIPIQTALGKAEYRTLRSPAQNGLMITNPLLRSQQKESSSLTRSAMAIVEQPKIGSKGTIDATFPQPKPADSSASSSVGSSVT